MATLTETYRVAQLRLGARTVAQLHAAFRLLDASALDDTFAAWLAVVTPIIQANRRSSSAMAAAYLTALRTTAIGPDADWFPTPARPADAQALRTSMIVTGPASIKNAMTRGLPLGRALDIADARSAAAGMRHALNGGRDTILGSIASDDRAQGWRRVSGGKSCAFCASLTGRVFSPGAADFAAHDGCSCTAEPVYV